MRTSVLTILVVVLAQCVLFGQSVLPPVYEIKSDTVDEQRISITYYQILEDKGGKLTIGDVTSLPISDQFHSRNKKSGTRDALSNTYWFRYRLKNATNLEANIALRSISEYDDFYLALPDGNWKHYISGGYNEWDKKDGLRYFNCIPIVFQPNEEHTVYQRIQNRRAGLAPGFFVSILSAEKMIKEENLEVRTKYYGIMQIQEAFVVGLLFLAMFFNLFFFLIVREKVYLYFSLFVMFLSINRLINFFQYFFMIDNIELLRYVDYLRYAWAFIVFFLIQFFRQFFQTKVWYPRWDKWLLGLAIWNLILLIVRFLSEHYLTSDLSFLPNVLTLSIFVLMPLSVIITLLLFVRRSDKSIRLVIIGSFPLMLFYLLSVKGKVAEIMYFKMNNSPLFKIFWDHFRLLEVICVCWMVLTFSWILFMRYDRLIKENAQHSFDKERLAKEKEMEKNELIARQKTELERQVTERTADLKQSLENLKSTQSQLIQSEKMASLGELTAGIAHEIQNPLNFVNNFSEVNSELIGEMEEEIDKGNLDEAKKIAKDIRENQQKINHHGKRADSIVKGMLQHSRTSTGQKEPTDINALADEYLRLAYHGLRAKDKTFKRIIRGVIFVGKFPIFFSFSGSSAILKAAKRSSNASPYLPKCVN